jgi:misacylated tRNA(Ala) deacylase
MAKNYDPRMHTAEHILNRTMDRMFGCGRCFSAHIEAKKSKCDYHFTRPLLDAEVKEIETRVNRIIKTDLPVTEKFLSYEEAETVYNLARLPENATEVIRVVNVGGYDSCPCIGPHVKSAAQIGRFQITSTGFENGVLRIRFRLPPV